MFNDTKPLLIVYHNKLLSWRSYLNCKYTCISENFAEVMLLHFPKIAPFIHESCTFIRKRSFYLINIALKSSVISFDTKMQIYFEYFNEALVLLIMFGQFVRSLFAERSMFQIIFDLYAAGTETSSTGLLWTVLYLIKYPVVQTKCAAEIKRVRPRDH